MDSVSNSGGAKLCRTAHGVSGYVGWQEWCDMGFTPSDFCFDGLLSCIRHRIRKCHVEEKAAIQKYYLRSSKFKYTTVTTSIITCQVGTSATSAFDMRIFHLAFLENVSISNFVTRVFFRRSSHYCSEGGDLGRSTKSVQGGRLGPPPHSRHALSSHDQLIKTTINM